MGDAGPPQGDAAQGVPAPSILLFGGIAETADGGYTEVNDTWVWTAPAGWTEVHPARPPSARYGAMGASLGGDVVLFGGDGPVAETWTWNGTTWTQQQPSFSPPPLVDSVFTLLGQSLVLFGGSNGGTIYDDVWRWGGTNWTHDNPSVTPPPRDAPAGAALDGSLVIFGGEDDNFLPLGDTWAYDGTSWTQMQPEHSPSPRRGAVATAYGGKIILFGGDTIPPSYGRLAQRRRDLALGRNRLDSPADGAVSRGTQLCGDGRSGWAGRSVRREQLRGDLHGSGGHLDVGRDGLVQVHGARSGAAKRLHHDGQVARGRLPRSLRARCAADVLPCHVSSGSQRASRLPVDIVD